MVVDTQGRPKRLMAISAHPDDMEFGCAGTIAKWIREGWEGALVICTDGRAGTSDPDTKPEDLIRTRANQRRGRRRRYWVSRT